MRTVSFVFAYAVILTACNAAETNPDNGSKDTTIQASAADTTLKDTVLPAPVAKVLSHTDSLDLEHNQSVAASGDQITKAYFPLSKGDSTLYLTAYMRNDHRIFGYAAPDIHSERLILYSIFTSDVQDNPFKCRYGAYYQISASDSVTIRYVSADKSFVKTQLISKSTPPAIVYFEKKWIDFE